MLDRKILGLDIGSHSLRRGFGEHSAMVNIKAGIPAHVTIPAESRP